MRAAIMCGGYGTRLRPLTDTVCKPMTDICGKPCLERIIDHLTTFGITDIVVNVHWLKEQIMEYFGNRLLYYYEPELLGAEETERRLRPWLGQRYLVLNGDTLSDVHIKTLISNPEIYKDSSIACWDREKDVYIGTKFIDTRDIEEGKSPHRVDHLHTYWIDIGTSLGLEEARKHYKIIKF